MDFQLFCCIIDWVVFIAIACSILYLLIFVLASKFYHSKSYPDSDFFNRILVLFPAYKEDDVILSSVNQFLQQNYPKDKYVLAVISDHMKDETNESLRILPISLLEVDFEKSSKAKALNFAINYYDVDRFDIVTILDADNVVEPVYLCKINNTYNAGVKAMQAHRTAKNLQNDVAIFDAVSEEVNNTIFRKGHCALGLSSALVGSGMAFDYKWFVENVVHLRTAGEDKELETLLMTQFVHIEYLEDLHVMDEKTSMNKVFYSQRQRWLSAQYTALNTNIRKIAMCFRTGNINYLDKIFQWMLLPRVVLFGLTALISFVLLLFVWPVAVKWLVLFFLLCVVFVLAIPWSLFWQFIRISFKILPITFVIMIFNFFRIKKGKSFIHTPHGQE